MRILIAAAALAAGGFMIYYFGIRDDVAAAMATPGGFEESDAPKKPRTQFAEDRADGSVVQAAQEAKPLEIDGQRTMGYLARICAIGPRQSGTGGMRKQQEILRKHFDDLGLTVTLQTFQARQNSQREPVEMTNLIASVNPERKRRVILSSHYDTRPIADQESDPRKWREPFVSANDGGSGVALLMELANHLPKWDTKVGVDLVLFDGEEFIFERDRDKYFFGSDHFAKTWKSTKSRPEYVGAVLFDMIGGKTPRFPVEGHSWLRAKDLCLELWRTAGELKCKAFLDRMERVLDDHLALQNAGIPAVDIIDFDYPHWHKLSDTPENCSPDGLVQVARVISVWLQRMK